MDGRDQKYPVTRKTLRAFIVEDVSLQSQTWKYFSASRVTIYALNDCVWRLEVATTYVLYVSSYVYLSFRWKFGLQDIKR